MMVDFKCLLVTPRSVSDLIKSCPTFIQSQYYIFQTSMRNHLICIFEVKSNLGFP